MNNSIKRFILFNYLFCSFLHVFLASRYLQRISDNFTCFLVYIVVTVRIRLLSFSCFFFCDRFLCCVDSLFLFLFLLFTFSGVHSVFFISILFMGVLLISLWYLIFHKMYCLFHTGALCVYMWVCVRVSVFLYV